MLWAETLDAVYETDLEQVRQRTALILSVPSLWARSREQHENLVQHLGRALAERAGAEPAEARIQVEAAVCAEGNRQKYPESVNPNV